MKPLKSKLRDWLLLPVGIMLIILGIGHIALTVAGGTVTAKVTGYEQVLILNNDQSSRNPSRYKLEYQFVVNGERYDGSVTRVFEEGSHMQKILRVRYLPFWPHVNAEDGTGMVLAGPVAMGLGVLILTLTVRRHRKKRAIF